MSPPQEGRAPPTEFVRVDRPRSRPDERVLWPGTRGPRTGTPERRAGSVRRTTSLDMLRPDGLFGDLVLVGRGRDLATGDDGSVEVLGSAGLRCRVEFVEGRAVRAIATDPPDPAAAALVGAPATSGFRAAVAEALPDERARESVLYQLLDDIPVATLISGSVFARNGWHLPHGREPHRLPWIGVCAGWAPDAAMTREALRAGVPTFVGEGPPAGSLASSDEQAWHPLPTLPARSYRRVRRMDAWHEGHQVVVETYFRDSYVEDGGVETSVHEYSLRALVDDQALTVVDVEAVPHVLPGPDCAAASMSAADAVGIPIPSMRRTVGEEFGGVSTCTHLNDTLRSLNGVAGLLRHVGIAPEEGA